jgi:YHS domain-containing protein
MNRRKRLIQTIVVVPSVALALVFFASGCGKKEEPMAQQSTPPTQPMSEQMMAQAHDTATAADKTAMAAIEQKTCPVMEGNPIDPNIFVEYKGKKVYFCCPACPPKFLADPEKYISKLPQFQQ